jgi:uncharacterized protein (TIGR03435 family)
LRAAVGNAAYFRTGEECRHGRSDSENHSDLDLTWMPDSLQPVTAGPAGAPRGDTGPSLFTALQEQLGLKLSPERGELEVLVIDHVERPTPD